MPTTPTGMISLPIVGLENTLAACPDFIALASQNAGYTGNPADYIFYPEHEWPKDPITREPVVPEYFAWLGIIEGASYSQASFFELPLYFWIQAKAEPCPFKDRFIEYTNLIGAILCCLRRTAPQNNLNVRAWTFSDIVFSDPDESTIYNAAQITVEVE